MALLAKITKLPATVARALAARGSVAAAPVVLVALVVGVVALSNRTDPAKVQTKEDAPVHARRQVSTSQGMTDVPKDTDKGKDSVTSATAVTTRSGAAPRATDPAAEITPATPAKPAAPTSAAAPTTAAPEDLSGLIGPVPPEPWPEGCRCAPLTGLGYDSPFGAGGPAVAVKVSNASQADPQTGLNRADLIYEEPSHGIDSVSRFLGVFHSRDVDTVGPVRSARTSDPPLLAPMGRPILAYAGANKGVHWIIDIRERDGWLVQAHENKDGEPEFFRLDGRRDEHSLFARRNSLVQSYGGSAAPPNQQFSFLDEGQQNAGAKPAGRVALKIAGTSSGFIWDTKSKMWLRNQNGRPHVNKTNGAQIGRSSVIVLTTKYQGSFADAASLEAVTFPQAGERRVSGQAWVFTGNTVTQGTWSRGSDVERFDLRDLQGRPMGLQRGPVYVGLTSAPPTYS